MSEVSKNGGSESLGTVRRLEDEGSQKNKGQEFWGQKVGGSGIWGQRAEVMGSRHEVMIKVAGGYKGVYYNSLDCYH